ncbi:oligosaccharide flippase family protein [Microbacterium aerolatum]|uniref:oligosaccharide flippase family protein n=1 Tax=Microbacterium aerolatum TaxID=153731 RepID=UPI00384B8404
MAHFSERNVLARHGDSGHRLGRNILTLISGTFAAQLVTLAAIPILSRLYGPTPFGEFAVFSSVTTLVAVVGTARYEMGIVPPRSLREAVAVTNLGVRLLTALSIVITAIGTVLVFMPIPSVWTGYLLLVGPGVFLLGYLSLVTQWHVRMANYSLISRNRVVQSGMTAIAQVAFGFLSSNWGVGLASGLLIGQLAGAILLTIATPERSRFFGRDDGRRWRYVVRKYWRLPALLMPHTLIDSFRLNGVNLIIGSFSVVALGQYSQAWRLVQLPAGLIGSAITQVYFPQLATVPRSELRQTVRSSVVKSLAFGAIPFAAIFLLSPFAFPFILGEDWAEAGRFAQALTPALYLNLAASPISTIFIVLRKEHIGLLFSLVYTGVSLAALFLFSSNLLFAVWIMSACQAISLIGYVVLAFWLAGRQPKRPGGAAQRGL